MNITGVVIGTLLFTIGFYLSKKVYTEYQKKPNSVISETLIGFFIYGFPRLLWTFLMVVGGIILIVLSLLEVK